MARPLLHRDRRRQLFLRVLLCGQPVTRACEASGLRSSTVYEWRQNDAAFRQAWSDAIRIGAEATAARLDAARLGRADRANWHDHDPEGSPRIRVVIRKFGDPAAGIGQAEKER